MSDPILESQPPPPRPADYETLLESASEGICAIDRQGRFAYVNRAAAEMLGYPAAALLGQSCHNLWHHSRPDGTPYPEEVCPFYAGYARGVSSEGEEEFLWRKDNTSFPVLYGSNPTYEDGALTGAVIVFRDITHRKCAEAEIARRTADLAAQNAITATLSRSLDLETNLVAALDIVLAAVDMDVGLIYVLDPDSEELSLHHCRTRRPEQAQAFSGPAGFPPFITLSSQAMASREPVVHTPFDSLEQDASSGGAAAAMALLISAPLIYKDRPVGALTLAGHDVRPVLPPTLALITATGEQMGMAIENAHLYRSAEQAVQTLARLHQVSIFLTSTFDPLEIYDRIAGQSASLLDCQIACVLTWDDEGQHVELVASHGIGEAESRVLGGGLDAPGCLADLARCRTSRAVSDARADPRVPVAWKDELGVRALLCVAIQGIEQPLGTLILMDRRAPRQWRPHELALIESFVNRAALALTNAYLHTQLEWAAALQERQRIAADMHDGLAQTIGILGLQVDEAMELTARGDNRQASEMLTHARRTIDRAYSDIRQSIASLQHPLRPDQSLQETLPEVVAGLPLQEGPPVEIVYKTDESLYLPPALKSEVLLIVREALINARRHARASRIAILLAREGPEVSLTVEDDGCGFDPAAHTGARQDHFGLGIMQARAARLGGRLQVDSVIGRGSRVTLRMPLNRGHFRAGGLQP